MQPLDTLARFRSLASALGLVLGLALGLVALAACGAPPEDAAAPAATEPATIDETDAAAPEDADDADDDAAEDAAEDAEEDADVSSGEPAGTDAQDWATYMDGPNGFSFEHPAAWEPGGVAEQQARGQIRQLTRDGAPVLDITVLDWTPADDLPAFLEVRRTAWDSSGMDIVSEDQLALGEEGSAALFVLRGVDGEEGAFYFAPVNGRYLSLSGQDSDALARIARTVRLLPAEAGLDAPEDAAAGLDAGSAALVTEIDCMTTDTSSLDYVACNIQDAIRSQNLYAAPGYMTDPFAFGLWRSEGTAPTPQDMVQQIETSYLPPDPSAITFTADPADFPALDGMSPAAVMGPDAGLRLLLFSQGWGPDGQGEGFLYFGEDEGGSPLWTGMLYAPMGFDM